MIATVLAQREEPPSALAAKWRQLVDLLAQGAEESDSADAFAWLRDARARLPAALRRQAAESLSGRRVSPGILAFFAEDQPQVAAPLLAGARLPAEAWLDLLPSLTPTARSLLRHRRDLPSDVSHALAGFGGSDLAPSGGVAEEAGVDTATAAAVEPLLRRGDSQIRELVARIETFRRQREAEPASPDAPAPVESFHWEAGVDGILFWVEGAPRGPIVGQSIASIAERGQYGVDGQAAGAFEKRAPFRDARFSVAGSGAASGDWRISGVPFFDPRQGHFLGYRGTARRPRVDEVARPDSAPVAPGDGLFGTSIP